MIDPAPKPRKSWHDDSVDGPARLQIHDETLDTPAADNLSTPLIRHLSLSTQSLGLNLTGDDGLGVDERGSALITSAVPGIRAGSDTRLMAADSKTTSAEATAGAPLHHGSHVCPFCAYVRDAAHSSGACPKCTMEDNAATRRSTGERIGPWFVLQRRNPTAPGLRFSVLLTLARRGHVTAKSIVRGPTTGQLWKFASDIKGLSRLFGLCWHCHKGVSPDAQTCPHCRSAQEIADDPDAFLENQASMLPVMREVSASRALPQPEPVPNHSLARQDDFDFESPLPAPLPRSLASPRTSAPADTALASTGRDAGSAIMSASELAAMFQLDTPQPSFFARTRRRVWKVIRLSALLVLIVGTAGAIVVTIKPDWGERAVTHAQPYLDRASHAIASAKTKLGISGAADSTEGTAPTLVSNPPPLETTRLESTPPITPPESTPAEPIIVSSKPTRQPIPRESIDATTGSVWSPLQPKPDAGTPTVVDVTREIDALAGQSSIFRPTTRPASRPKPIESSIAQLPPSNPPTPQVTNSPTKPLSTDEAIAQANELRTAALDAEARKDWKAAVLIWEQIGTLPESARPSDLRVRLAVAKERLAGS